jgi:hypothetical protein
MSFFNKVAFYYFAMTVKRFFYYGPFCFTTGGFIASGLGYNGGDKWDKVVGVIISEVELGYSTNQMMHGWNH